MSTFTQGYDIVRDELHMLKKDWPIYFTDLSWPLMAMTIKVALGDRQVESIVREWSRRYRGYDQGIAYENMPVRENTEKLMNQRLSYWSHAWDSRLVRMIHDAAYEGFRHPTEEECQAAERAAIRGRKFGILPE